jgi:hypothetical protein
MLGMPDLHPRTPWPFTDTVEHVIEAFMRSADRLEVKEEEEEEAVDDIFVVEEDCIVVAD